MTTDVLTHELRHYREWLDESAVTELNINGELAFVDRQGAPYQACVKRDIDPDHVYHLATLIAGRTGDHLNETTPYTASTLPDGTRVHAIVPPAGDQIYLSLRKHLRQAFTLDEYLAAGVFDETVNRADVRAPARRPRPPTTRPEHWPPYLRDVIEHQETVVIAGPTDSGKTTVMRALAGEIPERERLVLVQDVDELAGLPHENVVKLMVGEWAGADKSKGYTLQVHNALRLNPSRLLVQEIRGPEALAFLTAARTGHCGMTTVHAGSALEAFDRMAGMVLEAPGNHHLEHVLTSLKHTIGTVVQAAKVNNQRIITEVYSQ